MRQKIKCDCCGQTLFYKDADSIEIKCSRCKNPRTTLIQKIAEFVGDILKI